MTLYNVLFLCIDSVMFNQYSNNFAPAEPLKFTSTVINVPQDAPSLMEAMELCRKLATERSRDLSSSEVVVNLDEGEHEVVGSWTSPHGPTHEQTIIDPNVHLKLVGTGTIIGGLVVENAERLYMENLTVKNPSGPGIFVSGEGTYVSIHNVTFKECQQQGVYMNKGAHLNASECQFIYNGSDGICFWGATADLYDCTSHHNRINGVAVNEGAVVNIYGTATSVHHNRRDGLSAWHHGSIINIHEPCVNKDVSHDNKQDDFFATQGGHIFTINYGT